MTRLSWVSLAAALALTAQAEWTLALSVGWWIGVAWCWPGAVDLYVVAAFRARRDRAWAIGLMAASVASAHALPRLWPAGMPPLVAGLMSVVPVLVAWRVHEMPSKTSGAVVVSVPASTPQQATGSAAPGDQHGEARWRSAGQAAAEATTAGSAGRPRPDVSDLLLAGQATWSRLPAGGRTYQAFAAQFKADGHRAGTERLKELFRTVRDQHQATAAA